MDVGITPGPVFRLRRVTLDGAVPPEGRAALQLESGAPAIAADVLAAQGRVLDALRRSGHALAKVDPPVAMLDPGAQALDVSYKVDAGPAGEPRPHRRQRHRARGPGLRPPPLAGASRRALRPRRDRARPAGPGLPRRVRHRPRPRGGPAGRPGRPAAGLRHDGAPAPCRGRSPPRSRPTWAPARASPSSTATCSARPSGWTWAPLSRSWAAAPAAARATTSTASLLKPDVWARNQTIQVNVQAIKENLDAYNRTAELAGVTLSRKLSAVLDRQRRRAGAAVAHPAGGHGARLHAGAAAARPALRQHRDGGAVRARPTASRPPPR